MTAADEAANPAHARESLSIAQHVHCTGVGAARHDHQALVLHVDDHVLVVPDHRIWLPTSGRTDVVDRESLLEIGHAPDLTGYQDGVVHQQRRASLFDQLEALRFDVRAAGRRQTEFGTGWEDNLALAPGFGVDDERQPSAAVPYEQTL